MCNVSAVCGKRRHISGELSRGESELCVRVVCDTVVSVVRPASVDFIASETRRTERIEGRERVEPSLTL